MAVLPTADSTEAVDTSRLVPTFPPGPTGGSPRMQRAGDIVDAGLAAKSIEDGAQRNPLHIVRFAAIDADTVPSGSLADGEIGLYTLGSQIQAAEVSAATTIYVPRRAAAFGVDATDIAADLSAVDVARFGDDIVANVGSDAVVLLAPRGSTDRVWFQAGTVSAYGVNGYAFANLTHLKGSHTPASAGVSWNVVAVVNHATAVKDIIDVERLVLKTDIAGHESDEYASYSNGIINSGYRSGFWSLFAGTGAPTGSGIGQPDIASGSGVVVFGRLRTDKDPNKVSWSDALAAVDYPSGRIIHAYVEGSENPGHVRITLTGAGTLVGTGDAAYVWAPASWVEVGDVGPVDEGDWWRLSEYEPSDLDIRIPARDVIDPPWIKPSGTTLSESELTDDDEIVLVDGDTVTVRQRDEYHDLHHVGTLTIPNLRYVTTTTPSTGGDINFAANQQDSTRGIVAYKYADAAARNAFKPKIVVGRRFTLRLSDSINVKGVIDSTPADLFGRLSFNLVDVTTEGTRTNNHAASIIVASNIPATDQLVDAAFTGSSPNVAGKGGSPGQVWTRGSSSTNGDWADSPALSAPVISDVLTVTSSWQSIATGYADADIVTVTTEGAYSSEATNIAMAGFTNRFDRIPTGGRWVGIRANTAGARIEVRRNGTAIQARAQGSTAATKAWATKWPQ